MKAERYKIDKINASHLVGNPIGSPATRDVHIYLPPGYDQYQNKRYPAVYFLHGYTGNTKNMNIPPNMRQRMNWLPAELLDEIDWTRICDYEKLDYLIENGELAPFILVQPDGSLYLPDKYGTYDINTGETRTKGSFYINSKYTGDFEDFILEDVVNYIDTHYRTIADRMHRALAGVSMGGYGTLSMLCHHPEKFSVAAALSPGNMTLDLLDWKMVIPLQERLLGRAEAEKGGGELFSDVFDTLDIVYSKDSPLIPTLVRDDNGKTVSMDRGAADVWKAHDINGLAEKYANNLQTVPLVMNCESTDEFGLMSETKKLHDTFNRLGIHHEYEIYDDENARKFSPHIFGIAYHIIPAFKFILKKIAQAC